MAEIKISDDAIIRQIIWAVRDPGSIVPRNGHKESDDDWTARAVRCVLGGRLLPSGGEVSTQWTVRWRWTPTGEVDELTRPASEGQAREVLRDAQRMEAAEAILYRRDTRTWPDGSYYVGPWEVVSDTSAGQEGLPASTDGVAPPAGDEINK